MELNYCLTLKLKLQDTQNINSMSKSQGMKKKNQLKKIKACLLTLLHELHSLFSSCVFPMQKITFEGMCPSEPCIHYRSLKHPFPPFSIPQYKGLNAQTGPTLRFFHYKEHRSHSTW